MRPLRIWRTIVSIVQSVEDKLARVALNRVETSSSDSDPAAATGIGGSSGSPSNRGSVTSIGRESSSAGSRTRSVRCWPSALQCLGELAARRRRSTSGARRVPTTTVASGATDADLVRLNFSDR